MILTCLTGRYRPSNLSSRQSGSILIVCFFVLITLTLFTVTVGYTLRQKMQVLLRIDTRQKLRAIGDAGAQASVYQLLRYRQRATAFDTLNQAWSRNEAVFKEMKVGDGFFSVAYKARPSTEKLSSSLEEVRYYGLVDEERKINLNLVGSAEILQRLFKEVASLGSGEAKILADSVFDWKDKNDDTVSSMGAEGRFYHELTPPYSPRNAKFVAVEELQWIRDMKPEIYEKIRPYVTLDSSGQVNLNTAPREVLSALGFSMELCDAILRYRRGSDAVEGTADDRAFSELSTVGASLAQQGYLQNPRDPALETMIQSGMLTVSSRFFMAQVEARLNYQKQALHIEAVFDEKGTILRWEERFVVA